MTEAFCFHPDKRIVWTKYAKDAEPLAGAAQLRHQCVKCGLLLANALPHTLARPDTPEVDLAALQEGNRRWTEYYAARRVGRNSGVELVERTLTQSIADRYRAYLMTDAWRSKRAKAIKRANGVCEGCGEARAVEVHHLSYAHLGDELLWELKAVCRSCHAKCHPGKMLSEAAE